MRTLALGITLLLFGACSTPHAPQVRCDAKLVRINPQAAAPSQRPADPGTAP